MKKLAAILLLIASVSVSFAATVASYSAGVLPGAGNTGAADPLTQGWTASTATPGDYNWGGDSTIGGWRITDGTTTAGFFYHKNMSIGDAQAMALGDWTARWTTALVADAISRTGGGVDNYYTANYTRQTNNALWIEVAGQFAYVLSLESDASGNVVLSDSHTDFAITTEGNQMAQELGTGAPGNEHFITFTLNSVGGVVTLSDSLGGNHGPVAAFTGIAPATDRVVWGAFSAPGQGSSVWNEVLVTVVPEPGSISLLALGAVAVLLRRRIR